MTIYHCTNHIGCDWRGTGEELYIVRAVDSGRRSYACPVCLCAVQARTMQGDELRAAEAGMSDTRQEAG